MISTQFERAKPGAAGEWAGRIRLVVEMFEAEVYIIPVRVSPLNVESLFGARKRERGERNIE